MRAMTDEQTSSALFDELSRQRAENQRMIDCLFAIKDAHPNTTIEAVRSVAYDVAMNLMQPDVAEHQLRVRSGMPQK